MWFRIHSRGSSFLTRRGVRLNRRYHRQTGPQPIKFRLPTVQHDFDWNALNDLCEISGRVVGWQKSELRSARWRYLVDRAMKNDAGKCVDLDLRTISSTHVTDLRF